MPVSEKPTAAVAGNIRNIQIQLAPNPCFVDEEVRIVVSGLPPRGRVLLRALAEDDEQRQWASRAEFIADGGGTVDTHVHSAKRGDYRGVSPMGLFWSMRPEEGHENGRGLFVKKDERENRVEIVVEVNGREQTRATLWRRFAAPDTKTRELSIGEVGEGNVGKLFIPPGRGPHPAVIVVSGSGGGFDQDKAAVLSRHGLATLALAYFGIPPLPNWLHKIPMEYFEGAIRWLGAQPEVDARRIGVLGVSRGAELALLLAAATPQIGAVVAYAPSHVAWAAGGWDKETREQIPVWTRGGEAIPFVPLPLRGFMLRSAIPVVGLKRPVVFRNLFRAGLRNRRALAKAVIPVETIAGPILLISGGDDRVWPAGEMSERILARLRQNHFKHAAEHLHYPRAGHMLRYPFLPTTPRSSRNAHLRNAKFVYGGTPEADALADAEAWRRAVGFLRRALTR